MTRQYRNISGGAISVPEVADHDVADQEVIDVPDDAVMSTEYFTEEGG